MPEKEMIAASSLEKFLILRGVVATRKQAQNFLIAVVIISILASMYFFIGANGFASSSQNAVIVNGKEIRYQEDIPPGVYLTTQVINQLPHRP